MVKPRWFEFWKKPEAMRLTGNQLNITDAMPARDSKSLFALGRVESGAMQVFDPRAGKLVPFLGGLPALGVCGISGPAVDGVHGISERAFVEEPVGWQRGGAADGRACVDGTVVARMGNGSPIPTGDKIYRVSAEGGAPEKLMPEGDNEVMPALVAGWKVNHL